jgi:hypothetical protein
MSRKDDLINSYGGVSGIMAQTPDAKARIRNELLEAARQDAIDANNQASKAAQGSLTNDLAGVGGSVAGIVGGSYLGNQIFGGGSAAASGAGAGAGTGGAVGGAAGAGASTTGAGMLAGNGALATYGVPAAVAAGTYLAGKSIYDGIQGKKDNSPSGLFGRGQAAFSTMGLSEIPRLFGFGHSKRYYEGQDRKNLANSFNEKFGPGTMNVEQFKNDPTSFNYDLSSPNKNKELGASQALTAILTGAKSDSKTWSDLSSRFANDIKGGMSVKDLYSKFGGLDYQKATDAINSSSYDAKLKAELQNGLNDAFGGQPRQQSNQGSPGRRPQQQQSKPSNQGVKKKAKDASNVLANLWK